MNRYRTGGLVVIAAHLSVAVWHLFLAAQVLPRPNNNVSLLGVMLITLMHLVIGGVWWKLTDRLAGAILATFFLAALALDTYEHFLHRGGNNVFMVLPGEWKITFEVSVGFLMALELFGAGLGVRLLQPVDNS